MYEFSRNAKMIDGCYSSVLFMNVLLVTFQMCSITFQIFTVCGIICTFRAVYFIKQKNEIYIKFINNTFSIYNRQHIVFDLCIVLSHATIELYYFQIITDNLNVPIIRMIVLSFYITVMLTHLYAYCYAAERLIAEVKQLCTLTQFEWKKT